jgi:hypothetical protein
MKSRRRKIKRSRTKVRAGSSKSIMPLHIENDVVLTANHLYKIFINPVSDYVEDDSEPWYIEAEFIEYTNRGLRMVVHKTNIPSVSSHIVLPTSDILGHPIDITPAESTPRQHYVNTYLNKDIFLNKRTLFQVSIHKDQLDHYTQITPETRIECFIQTLFALGLRDIREAKKDVDILKTMTKGTPWKQADKYFQTIFGLKDGQIGHFGYRQTFHDNDDFSTHVSRLLQHELDNNYATILPIAIRSPTHVWFHFVIAYKYENVLYFFDPQNKITSTNAADLSRYTIFKFGFFTTKGVDQLTPLQSNTCSIKFNG